MSNVLGVDVSKWQRDMDWDKCDEAGAKFAFVRAGSINNVTGACYTDYEFLRNASLAPEHMPTGYYWYFRPNHDPVKQADYFCDLIEGEEQSLPPVIDLETSGNRTPRQVTEAAAAFIAKVYDRLTVWPIVYSRSYFLHDATIDHPLFHECDLWIARYTSRSQPWGNLFDYPKTKPPYWDDWTFWQYTSSGSGAEYGAKSRAIDLDYFNGDQEAFDEYIQKPHTSPEPPPDIGVKVDIEGVKYWGRINKVE
jgi:lysozyme